MIPEAIDDVCATVSMRKSSAFGTWLSRIPTFCRDQVVENYWGLWGRKATPLKTCQQLESIGESHCYPARFHSEIEVPQLVQCCAHSKHVGVTARALTHICASRYVHLENIFVSTHSWPLGVWCLRIALPRQHGPRARSGGSATG